MVQAEVEKNLTKDVDKLAQNGQKTSLTSQISDTLGVLDFVISELRSSQNGDAQDNAIASQLISSLTEIRGNTIRRNTVIVWQNPRILLKDTSVIKEPEKAPVEAKAPVVRKKTKAQVVQQETESLGEYVSAEQFYKTIGMVQPNWSRKKSQYPQVRTIRRGRFKFFSKEDAGKIRQIRESKKAEITIKKERPIRLPNGRKVSRPTEEAIYPTTISEFAAKHNLEIGKISEIARSHFNWGFNESSEQLSSRQQRLLSFYIESNLRTAPEGFMTVTQICETLGISNSAWCVLKAKNKLTSYKMGSRTFYKREDVDKIAKDRQQKANEKITARLERKPQFDKEFEEMIEDSEEQNSRSLDLFALHLAEIREIPVEIKKHELWGIKILSGQFAVRVLENLLNSNLLDPSQERQIKQILETPRAKYFSEEFKLIIKGKSEKAKTGKVDFSDKKFFEVLKRHDMWFDRLKVNNMPQVIEHQIKLFNSGSEAFDNLVTSNMRLVLTNAKKYLWSGFSISDLGGYGYEGLMKAAVKFDWRKGYQFSTYASSWIRQSITRAIANHSNTIRVPVHVYEKISKLKKESNELLQKGEDVDYEELANKVDPTGNVAKSLYTRNLISLNYAVGPNQDSFLEDFLEDVKSNMEENSDKIGMREALMDALDTLTPREKKVLMLRYGLEDGRSMPLDHVAAYLAKEGFAKVTRERIRQIESRALSKLRHHSRAKKLRPYFDDDPKALKIHPGEAAAAGRTGRTQEI